MNLEMKGILNLDAHVHYERGVDLYINIISDGPHKDAK